MDVAKVIAYLTKEENHGTKLDDIYGVGVAPGGRIPLVQVPTTAGTGSEVTQIAVVKRSETVKAGIVSPTLLPDWAVLDGALTCSCP
jgi:alcohol dehydrogenase class IV